MHQPQREQIVLESMSDECCFRGDPNAEGFADGGEVHDGWVYLREGESGESGWMARKNEE